MVADFLSCPDQTLLGISNKMLSTSDMAALQICTLDNVDHQAIAESQKACKTVKHHAIGNHPAGLAMKRVEFSPGAFLLCDTSTGRARPLVPAAHRKTIFHVIHQLNHPGQKPMFQKISAGFYWLTMLYLSSDNGTTFTANLWKNLQEALGTIVTFSPT